MTSSLLAYRLFQWSVVPLGISLLGLATMQPLSLAQDTPPGAQPAGAPPAMENGQQVLTRGPIHEAFGQPTVFNPKPGLAITKKPPQVVEELPPDEKPEGDNVSWIGGYWSWDEDKNDFMWISGFWRVLPPGRQWMPGYWSDNGGQFAWVSGYWANSAQPQQEVIEQAPPDSLELGAPPTAPSQDHIWIPGCYVYRDTRYLWRPGYWVVNQPGWCWVPATYCWTPSGYIYVDGYWDHSIRRRGVLFAPCYFDPVVVYRPGYYYRPAVCLDIELITPHFFCRPAYSHYYFGDYYATSYLSVGITPWFNFTYARGSRFYSSDFCYYEAHYRRTNPGWGLEVRVGYERYRDNVNLRPARTYVNQQTVINNITINNNKTTVINNNVNNMALAKPMNTYVAAQAKNPDAAMKFERINDAKARDYAKTATEVRKVSQERVALERNPGPARAPGKTGTTAGGTTAMRTMTLPKSPITSKMAATASAENGKTPNVANIGGQVAKTPPPIPVSGISSGAGSKTGSGSAGGSTGPVTTGPGSAGTPGAGSKMSGGSGTVGGSTTGPGTSSKTTGPGTVGGSTSGKSSSSPGSGSKSSGSSSGSKSGSSSSGSGGKKEKDKP